MSSAGSTRSSNLSWKPSSRLIEQHLIMPEMLCNMFKGMSKIKDGCFFSVRPACITCSISTHAIPRLVVGDVHFPPSTSSGNSCHSTLSFTSGKENLPDCRDPELVQCCSPELSDHSAACQMQRPLCPANEVSYLGQILIQQRLSKESKSNASSAHAGAVRKNCSCNTCSCIESCQWRHQRILC